MKTKNKKLVDRLFNISISLKGIDGVVEGLGGIILLLVNPVYILNIIKFFFQNELLADPDDFLANHLIAFFQGFSFSFDLKIFVVLYLLVHAITKIAIIIALLQRKLWAYPISEIILGIFVVFQVYKYLHNYSLALLFLSVFDLFVMILIWLEYGELRKKK